MKRILTLILCFTTFAIGLQAQKENYNWLFGKGAGLSWMNTRSYAATGMWGTATSTNLLGIPTIIPSSINTSEGCFSLSDVSGNLMMYSDGITIWDKNGNPMPNANGDLTGHGSSAQSGIIIPYPGDANRYIVFTLSMGQDDNLSYSVVNMELRGGLGDVIAGRKNIKLTGYKGVAGESLTAVRHNNREDFWIVAPCRANATSGNTAYLNVWKVDKNGVLATAVQTYDTGVNIVTTSSPGGYITFNQTGDGYIWTNYNGIVISSGSNRSIFLSGKFDNITGKILTCKLKDMGDRIGAITGAGQTHEKSLGFYV